MFAQHRFPFSIKADIYGFRLYARITHYLFAIEYSSASHPHFANFISKFLLLFGSYRRHFS